MRATSAKLLLSPCFSRIERELSLIFVCAIVLALAVPLGDFTSFNADSPPARAAALTAPDGGSPCFDDANGNVLTMRDANQVGWDAEYDEFNRVVKRTDTAGAVTRTAYDVAGNATDITDARNQTVHITYDARGRKATVTERIDVPPTHYAYDEAGRLSTITDSEGRITRYDYDERGQLVSETYPMGQQTSHSEQADQRRYTYDDARRLLTRTDQAGVVTTYGYDNANRMLSRTATDGSADAFIYDDAGRMTTASSGQYRTTINRFYNSVGQLDHEVQNLGSTAATVGYRYDAAGRPTQVIYPDGRVVAREFTERGQLQQVLFANNRVAFRQYDAGGRLTTTTLGNGLTESRTYQQQDNLLATLSVGLAVSFSYEFDANKRKTKEIDDHRAAATQRFDYDNADRLIAWLKEGDSQSWDLSPVGNWNSTTRNGVTETREHTDVHEVTRLSVPGQVTDLIYDTKGNLVRDTNGATYAWDAENRLRSATVHTVSGIHPDLSVDGKATYRYDALGRRLQKTVFGRSTTFIHDGDQVIQETDAPASVSPEEADHDGTLTGEPPGGALIADALVRVNFQPATSFIPDGFVADKGKALARRTNDWTYGWTDPRPSDHAVARGVYPYPQWDTHQRSVDGTGIHQTNAGTWKIALENGTYAVALVMGDPITTNQTNDVTINGVLISDPSPAVARPSSTLDRGSFDGYVLTATVSDGYLTISVPSTAQDSKLCFIEIGRKDSTADDALRQKVNEAIAKANHLTDQDYPPSNPSPRTYVYGSYVDEPLAMEIGSGADAGWYYLHANHLYSIAALSNALGAVVERYRYDAMGQRTVWDANETIELASSAYGNQIGFTGRYHDEETGLQYFRSRMYSARLGRFISRDSAGYVNGMGLYGAYYVPNATDPTGKQKDCPEDAVNDIDPAALFAFQALTDAARSGVLTPQSSLLQSAFVAYSYMGVGDAWSRAMDLSEASAYASADALDPMFFLSADFEAQRNILFDKRRGQILREIARENQLETVNEMYSMAMTDLVPAAMMGFGGLVANPISMFAGRAVGTAIMGGRAIWGAGTVIRAGGATISRAANITLNVIDHINPMNYRLMTGRWATSFPQLPLQMRTAYLYQKLSATGEHLKFGITSAANPFSRYTAKQMNGGSLSILTSGSRVDMLKLERSLHSTLPLGPEERQLFYIMIQKLKGLSP